MKFVTDIYLDIILLASSSRFQAYNIMSCDYGHIPLHYPRNKRKRKRKKIKLKKIDKIKIK